MVKQFITLCVCALMAVSAKADLMSDVGALQTGWAKAQYQLKDDPQEKAFLALIQQAKQATKTYPNAAEAWIWQGIIQSTYAGMASLFDQMDFVDGAKASLEKALKLDDKAMHGSAYTSIGVLYYKVPGWPLSFGDDDVAAKMLKKALTINPNGIDSNYFYADYLAEQDDYKQAKNFLLKAKAAPARPHRPIADEGRQREIAALLKTVNEELR